MADAPLQPPAAVVDAAWREGRLVYQQAADGRALWPPRLAAPGDGGPLTWHDSAGRGVVHAATALHGREGEPRSIVIVELDEGFRMMSSVEGLAATDVVIGLRVRVRFTEPGGDGTRLPVFEPDASPHAAPALGEPATGATRAAADAPDAEAAR